MKKFLLLACLSAFLLTVSTAPSSAYENEDDKGVSVTNVEVVRSGDAAKVTFALHVGDKVTAENRSLIIDPVLQNAGGSVSLYPIVIRGSRAQASNEEKAMKLAQISTEMPYHTSNGRTVEYVASIPWESWMAGSELVFNGISAGSGRASEVALGLVAGNLLADAVNVAPVAAPAAPVATASASGITSPSQSPVAQAILAEAMASGPVQTPGATVVNRPVGSSQVSEVSGQMAVNRAVGSSNVALQSPDARDAGTVVQKPVGSVSDQTYFPAAENHPPYVAASAFGSVPAPTTGPSYTSIGDELAARFMFVQPVTKYYEALSASSDTVFDYTMPLTFGTGVQQSQSEIDRFIEMTRQGSVFIQFNLGSQIVGRDFANNNRMLVDLISSIRLLESTPDVRIAHVVVAGFSAPEGTFAENEKLALDRAAVARDFLTANSHIDPKAISVYNGSIDWTTLRSLIANSNMPEKYTILSIIDNTPAWDTFRDRGRLERLMAVNDGLAYRYMREHFFPLLRQTGAYIKVYYENVR